MNYYRKYGNKKITIDGIEFDSRKEAERYSELKLLERAGEIKDLELQKSFELIPAYYEEIPTGEIYKAGEKKGQQKYKRVCIEKAVTYKADFVYKEPIESIVCESLYCDDKNVKDIVKKKTEWETVVEDTKGFKTKEYIIKRKLMLHVHGIRIKEV